jgi:signal transduction histidine kinase
VNQAVLDGKQLIEKMSDTIKTFGDVFRPEKVKRAFSARTVLKETLALLDATNLQAGVLVEIEEASEVLLFGYANDYSQLLMNLLANARQAIEASGAVRGKVTVRLAARDGLGCLTVRDNGGGVPDDLLGKIFEPYFSTRPGGIGIGLSMSRQLVERGLGGRIEVQNVVGGAEVTVLTPLYAG